MTRILTLLFAFSLLSTFAFSQKTGYQIKIKIDGFAEKEAYLGYYFGDKQYIKDTAYVEADGRFYFEGNQALDPGMYLVVLPPDNQFFQVLVNEGEQWFSLDTKGPDYPANMKVEGSQDNQLFYDYLNYLSSKRPEAEDLRKKMDEAGTDEKKKEKLEEKLAAIDKAVTDYQLNILQKHPKSLTAAIINANRPLDMPKFAGEKEERDRQSFYWLRSHWFDHLDLADPRMVRTPFLFQKVQHFVEKMTVQHPDSIVIAIDRVLEASRPAPETFKYYLIHFLNEYAKSKLVGMDAVYVHIGEKYYCNGQAPWTEEEQLAKICDNVAKLGPLLIGKVAPDIQMVKKGQKKASTTTISGVSTTSVKMDNIGGVYEIPCEINGLKLKFIFDTGASNVSISMTEALFMLKNGYLEEKDILESEYYSFANGEIGEGTVINLKSIKIGGKVLQNVKASVIHSLSAPLLLGNSALSQLGNFRFDYSNEVLIFEDGSKKKSFYRSNYEQGETIWLHEFQSPLTVLFFWDPDCGHCKKSMPEMVDFAKKYKDQGVAVFAICTSLVTRDADGNFSMEEVDKCWSTVDEREMDVFFNYVDPYHRSRYKTLYDIRSTPQIYVLDTDKTILSKRIGAEQLPEVIDHILKVKAGQ